MKGKKYTHYILIMLVFMMLNKSYSQPASSISIDISSTVGDTIKPLIYGGFIEFIWDVIDNKFGLWAQEIKFRGLENWTLVTKNPTDTLPYFKISSKNNLTWSLDTSRVNLTDSCSRKIQVTNYTKGHCGIGQSDINLNPGEIYNVYVYLKGEGITKGITVWILESIKDWKVIDSITFQDIGSTWKKYSGNLKANTLLHYGTIAVTIQESGEFWIDEISMMPQSAVNGVRKEYVDMINILKPTIMRYPGGCFADGQANHWQNGIGDIDQRATRIDNHWNYYQRMDFGTDEYIRFCKSMNIKPQITVNFGSGTPEEAANWVEYTNGNVNTTFGKLRSDNGNPQPYNIKFWEVGNEQYGGWEIGHRPAREYAELFNEYADEMKAKDPSIKIIANGDLENLNWTNTLLTISGSKMDYLSIHFATPFDEQSYYTDTEVYYAVAAASEYFKTKFNMVVNSIDSITAGKVKIVLSEWWNEYGDSYNSKHGSSQEIAVHVACMLNFFQQKSDILDIANRSTFVEILKTYNPQFEFFLAPSAYVLSLYSNYSGNLPLATNVVSPTYSLPSSFGNIPIMSSIPNLDVSATKKGNKIFINVVNRCIEYITTNINIDGGAVEPQGVIRTINGPSIVSQNFEFPHNSVTLITSQINNAGKSFQYKFPAHSVTGIELTEQTTDVKDEQEISGQFELFQNYPNPFNPITIIKFALTRPSVTLSQWKREGVRILLKVYDILGCEVAVLVNETKSPGAYEVEFDGSKLSSGIYFYQLQVGDFSVVKNMVLLR